MAENSEALTQLEDEKVRASREPTHDAASTGRQECKGYKITLQEYEENADKKASKSGIGCGSHLDPPTKKCRNGNEEYVPMIDGEIVRCAACLTAYRLKKEW